MATLDGKLSGRPVTHPCDGARGRRAVAPIDGGRVIAAERGRVAVGNRRDSIAIGIDQRIGETADRYGRFVDVGDGAVAGAIAIVRVLDPHADEE